MPGGLLARLYLPDPKHPCEFPGELAAWMEKSCLAPRREVANHSALGGCWGERQPGELWQHLTACPAAADRALTQL